MPAVLGVVLAPLALGCSDRSPEAVPGLDEPVAAEDTCEALPSESVSSLFAVDVVLDEERSGPSSCAYLSKDGAHEVVVRLEEIPSAAAMDVAVSELASLTGGDPEEVDPGEADEVIVIGADDAATSAMLVRKGGFAAQMELTGFSDEVIAEGRPLVVDWLLGGFPELPFDDDPVELSIDCESLDVDAMADAVGSEPDGISVNPSVGTDGCDVTGGSGPVVRIHAPVTVAGPESLIALGRVRTVDGVEFRSDPEAVEGRGDAAVWVLEPQTGASGDLYVVSGERMLRVTVSGGNSSSDELKATAVSVAGVIPPDFGG